METLPNQVSNAGPDSSDSEMDWRDFLTAAVDDIRDARRLDHDDLKVQYARRASAITDAIAQLQQALDKLPKIGVK